MKYLVIGDAILDHYVFGKVSRKSPEDPRVPVLDIESEEYRLGGCLNVAANLKSLSKDDDVYVSSIISTRCAKMLDSREIQRIHSFNLENLDGIKKTRIFNSEAGSQIVRLDNVQRFDEELLEEYQFLLNYVKFDDYDCVVVSDYKKGIVDEKTIKKLKGCEVPVFIDTKKSDLSIWDGIKNCIIKMNWDEWCNTENKTDHRVVVTDGKLGAFLYEGDSVVNFPTEEVNCIDVTGAGDVFLAGLVVGQMRNGLLGDAIRFANKAASKSVTMFGTVEVFV